MSKQGSVNDWDPLFTYFLKSNMYVKVCTTFNDLKTNIYL